MECPICFETKDKKDIFNLRCTHYMCVKCIKRLVNHTCPYCRTDIMVEVSTLFLRPLPIRKHLVYAPVIRIKRRRRKRRIKSDSININDQHIIVESCDSSYKKQYNDKKKQKYRQKRNKWACVNRCNFANRCRVK